MVYKTCSVNKIIAQFYRKYKPSNSGWANDAIEWIGDAIEEMGCHQGYSEQFKDLEIIDSRVKIPCEAQNILGIKYKNKRLRRTGGINHDKTLLKYPNCTITNLSLAHETYYLNPNYIVTSFQTGCITVYYSGLEVDCDGFPYVIDDSIYREALMWYILREMLGRGFKHQVFSYKDADVKWRETFPRAQNRCKMPDIDGMEKFAQSWLGTIKDINRANHFFEEETGRRNEEPFPPGSLLQTYQIIGNNTNNT